jgi:hypothetical protein
MGNKKTKNRENFVLTEDDIKILLDSTSFTREQIEEWYTGFLVSFNFMCSIKYSYFFD